jgi:dienelactone hydrolase
MYEPFGRGTRKVVVLDGQVVDARRGRRLPLAVWRPEHPAPAPVIVFSHHAGGTRRASSFLCRHLAEHGYVVAAIDHSEVAAPELAPPEAETEPDRQARVAEILASRVPDVRVLLDHLMTSGLCGAVDRDRVGVVGHSLGGWTALAVAQADERLHSVVALAPGGAARPRPGVPRLPLEFRRAVPTLYLTGEDDVPIDVDGVIELFERTPGAELLGILRAADHQHFVDEVAGEHEALRAMTFEGEAAWMPAAMRPIAELCSPEQAHAFTCGLTLAHFDATVRGRGEAADWLAHDLAGALAASGIDAVVRRKHAD